MKKTKTILMVAISILVPLITGFYLMKTIYETGESENYMNQDLIVDEKKIIEERIQTNFEGIP